MAMPMASPAAPARPADHGLDQADDDKQAAAAKQEAKPEKGAWR